MPQDNAMPSAATTMLLDSPHTLLGHSNGTKPFELFLHSEHLCSYNYDKSSENTYFHNETLSLDFHHNWAITTDE